MALPTEEERDREPVLSLHDVRRILIGAGVLRDFRYTDDLIARGLHGMAAAHFPPRVQALRDQLAEPDRERSLVVMREVQASVASSHPDL